MNETSLYRKYRPQKFQDVIGQDHIVKVLEGSVKLGNIAHAYLFSGSRGTGKTSMARIFAREIGTSQNDLYEIDAASNRGIDDIREIREGVNTLPFESPYKVYVIDEVHMLTKEAFNALLKTLEEPPKHAVFILATTEKEKLPETIVSRCQTYVFKKPNQKILKEVAETIAKKEGFTLDKAALELVAFLGDGSFRDMQGILQKVISSTTDKNITVSEVETVTGAPRTKLVNEFISALAEKDVSRGLKAVRSAGDNNLDMKIFATMILEKIRRILLLKAAPDMKDTIKDELSEEDFAFLSELASKKDMPINSGMLLELLKSQNDAGRSAVPELPLELAIMRIIGQDK